MTELFDVAVVGGGPAGSTTAALLAKRGYKVLLVEKEKFPRYHIGESTVPAMLSVLEELEVTEEVARHAFVVKKGVTLVWGRDGKPWSVNFDEITPLVGSNNYAFQVVRSEFDAILLNAARRAGALVLEETRVVDFLFEQDRCCGLKYVMGQGSTPTAAYARFVVDASGQNALLARQEELLEWDEDLKNIAIWTYYQGGKTLGGTIAGNILVEHIPGGWLWVIPLHDGTQSVGLVVPARNAEGRAALEDQLQNTITNSIMSKQLLASARRVSNYHTARDWSYKSKSMAGPGFLLTGDAAGFVDPLFSTGVFLAVRGASLAAEALDCIFKEPEKESVLLEVYERSYREFFDVIISFIHYFYDATKEKEDYWERAQELIDPIQQMTTRRDFILMVSGQAGVRKVMKLQNSSTADEESRFKLESAINRHKSKFSNFKPI